MLAPTDVGGAMPPTGIEAPTAMGPPTGMLPIGRIDPRGISPEASIRWATLTGTSTYDVTGTITDWLWRCTGMLIIMDWDGTGAGMDICLELVTPMLPLPSSTTLRRFLLITGISWVSFSLYDVLRSLVMSMVPMTTFWIPASSVCTVIGFFAGRAYDTSDGTPIDSPSINTGPPARSILKGPRCTCTTISVDSKASSLMIPMAPVSGCTTYSLAL
mmetsp:Transcript_29477/g.70693  ORF Transcript_29477/g.70693 Transcript_29477/m.70693 type:complete len:216 (+) Transcript_29477:210-857(+)